MTSQVSVCLGLLVLLALYAPSSVSGRLLCKDRLETCSPMAGDCCGDLTCRQGAAGRWSCQDKDIGGILDKRGGVCQRRGQICRPGLNNNCCPGLHCRNKPMKPNVHECW
ncbi:hypothetical protein ElyMa_002049800 [Elysia marginata]|uniref:Prokineticin domain-containing protein n=1 Tax=Elysia marginata TaxID=1093978 RepID=A0AAV4F7T0_9GAST|nr:hypothetical protein ElyMa_002049800 [Elysia marginata]